MTRQEAEQLMTREFEANERLLWSGVPGQSVPVFERIEDARSVYNQVRSAQSARRET